MINEKLKADFRLYKAVSCVFYKVHLIFPVENSAIFYSSIEKFAILTKLFEKARFYFPACRTSMNPTVANLKIF